MHDTAYDLGRLFFATYVGDREVSILEIGSLNVNGGLRDFIRPGWSYIGADQVAGDGVDIIIAGGVSLPFPDASFDVVVATSVLEHDEFFWETFAELARVLRGGGNIYINSPSNGDVHRYPRDYWRFYPEAGLAMARWAQRQGSPMVLIESFVAFRQTSSFNDYIAVFSKSPHEPTLPSRWMYEQVPCQNVTKYGEANLIKASSVTQDMSLLDDALRRAQSLEARLLEANSLVERARDAFAVVQTALFAEGTNIIVSLDMLTDQRATGWAWIPASPETRLQIDVRVNGAFAMEVRADQFRPDLPGAGIGDGCHAFDVNLAPLNLSNGDAVRLTAVHGLSAKEIGILST
jgi:SAM-dependent methyltransferase